MKITTTELVRILRDFAEGKVVLTPEIKLCEQLKSLSLPIENVPDEMFCVETKDGGWSGSKNAHMVVFRTPKALGNFEKQPCDDLLLSGWVAFPRAWGKP